jgi:hypothetical protein
MATGAEGAMQATWCHALERMARRAVRIDDTGKTSQVRTSGACLRHFMRPQGAIIARDGMDIASTSNTDAEETLQIQSAMTITNDVHANMPR